MGIFSIRTTREEAENKLFETHGGNISLLDYYSLSSKATFRCNVCGNTWEVIARPTIVTGHGCSKCSANKLSESRRLPFEKVVEFIESCGFKYIEGDYKNNESKLVIEFPCGHICKTSLGVIKMGCGCKKCADQKKSGDKRKPFEDIQEMLNSNNLVFIEFPNGYKNQFSFISYKCEFGHITTCQLVVFYRKFNCQECTKILQYKNRTGSKHPNWKGGTRDLHDPIKSNMTEWRKESAKNCGYKCVITRDRYDEIHHLYGFNLILREALEILNLEKKENLGEYTDDEIILIIEKTKYLHTLYPFGVCLRKDVHNLFHSFYGSGNNTPEQFYEFVDRIKTGEIKI